jgi:hypothetical protein
VACLDGPSALGAVNQFGNKECLVWRLDYPMYF